MNGYRTKERIPEITGFGHWRFLEYLTGKHDFNNGQLTGGTTPWIIRKLHARDAYRNQLFYRIHEEVKPVHRSAETLCQELHELTLSQTPPPPAGETEEAMRQAAQAEARREADRQRRLAIHLSLAELRSRLVALDKELAYCVQRADSLLFSHLCSYWKGILSQAQNCELPPAPPIETASITAGEEAYLAYRDSLLSLISATLDHEKEVLP